VAFVRVISSSRQTTLVLPPFFCRAYFLFPSCRNRRHRESNSWHLFRSFGPCVLFLVSENMHAMFGANRFIPSRAISEHTNKYKFTYPQLQLYI
jgi:hypothetical protein